MTANASQLLQLTSTQETKILSDWIGQQLSADTLRHRS